jgi:hypothetical protein
MTQINTWSIASGEDSIHEGKDGYILITPEDIYGDFVGSSNIILQDTRAFDFLSS